jgi:Leucine-rich repeat (LRR) protein
MTELSVFLRHAKRSNKKDLDLSNRELTYIPKEVFSMRTLEELDLSNNKIVSIEPEIKDMLRLKVLNLENNGIAELPE